MNLKESPLKSLISVNSIIYHIDNCHVTDAFTYYQCLFKLEQDLLNQDGYCMRLNEINNVASNFIRKNKISFSDLSECCNLNSTNSNYCFKWNDLDNKYYACLPARLVTEKISCKFDLDCVNNKEEYCIKPVSSNDTKLVKISHDQGNPILYVGSIKELIYSSS
jgi:hypothetical protein